MAMKRILLVTAVALFVALFGCGKKPESSPRLPEITSETAEGFVDLVFAITSSKIETNGSASFRVAGLHNGEQVGLEVLLRPPWKEGTLGEGIDLVTYQGIVAYRSVGPESDRLVQILDTLYESGMKPASMKSTPIHFAAFTLGGNPQKLEAGRVEIKLFHESENEEEYAEFYTNIDVRNGKLEIKEKDLDYRKAIIKALADQ